MFAKVIAQHRSTVRSCFVWCFDVRAGSKLPPRSAQACSIGREALLSHHRRDHESTEDIFVHFPQRLLVRSLWPRRAPFSHEARHPGRRGKPFSSASPTSLKRTLTRSSFARWARTSSARESPHPTLAVACYATPRCADGWNAPRLPDAITSDSAECLRWTSRRVTCAGSRSSV